MYRFRYKERSIRLLLHTEAIKKIPIKQGGRDKAFEQDVHSYQAQVGFLRGLHTARKDLPYLKRIGDSPGIYKSNTRRFSYRSDQLLWMQKTEPLRHKQEPISLWKRSMSFDDKTTRKNVVLQHRRRKRPDRYQNTGGDSKPKTIKTENLDKAPKAETSGKGRQVIKIIRKKAPNKPNPIKKAKDTSFGAKLMSRSEKSAGATIAEKKKTLEEAGKSAEVNLKKKQANTKQTNKNKAGTNNKADAKQKQKQDNVGQTHKTVSNKKPKQQGKREQNQSKNANGKAGEGEKVEKKKVIRRVVRVNVSKSTEPATQQGKKITRKRTTFGSDLMKARLRERDAVAAAQEELKEQQQQQRNQGNNSKKQNNNKKNSSKAKANQQQQQRKKRNQNSKSQASFSDKSRSGTGKKNTNRGGSKQEPKETSSEILDEAGEVFEKIERKTLVKEFVKKTVKIPSTNLTIREVGRRSAISYKELIMELIKLGDLDSHAKNIPKDVLAQLKLHVEGSAISVA